MKALRDLYEWRDKIARETDESCEFVLKNHQLLKIAELLPREIYGILALCNPLSIIVEQFVHEILEIIKAAREFSGTLTSLNNNNKIENSVETKEKTNNTGTNDKSQSKSVLESIVHLTTYDPNSVINCAHDFPQDAEDSMETNQHQEQDTLKDLNEIFLKPKNNESNDMPNNLIKSQAVSALTTLFSKDFQVRSSEKTDMKLLKKIKKLEEKVKIIKEEIQNPFQIFLPKEFREVNNIDNIITKWSLKKPQEVISTIFIKESQRVQKTEEPIISADMITMIPLKQQYKFEKLASGEEKRKPKKRAKNVDFTDAIKEYNNSKQVKINALGGGENEEGMINENQNNDIDNEINDQQKKLDELLQKKIRLNLNILSKESTNNSEVNDNSINDSSNSKNTQNKDTAQTSNIYTYNPQSMNKLFAKPELNRGEFDPASKTRNSKHSKVNKRRMTNAVTRMKSNQSLTYKVNSNHGSSGGNSTGK